MINRRILLQSVAATVAVPGVSWAQDKYPSRPIMWICPYAAGGNADNRSRQVARVMSPLLGATILIENKAGAGGNIGTEMIARAKPDGYTLGMGNFAPLAVNKALFKKLNFDPLTDLVPIGLIERGPLILMVRNDSPYKSVKDIVAAAKAAPGKLSYASGGIGGTHHLSGALFEHAAGIDMIHAPYKSGSAGAIDLMGGQVAMMFEQMYAAMPSIKGGKLRALAITSKARSPLAPEIPTMAEQGFPEVEVLNWQGLIGPKGLPADMVKLLNTTLNKALQDPGLREIILGQGNEVGGGTPEQFAALIRAEAPRWAKVVHDAKIEPE
ncbi:Bug family tripartite tricarboxylate transporter substrate binding protein [Caenimonas terrae]|uniref:Bug family tripartite tricarboxylate transporter substrate binding protein n=1 Tax=Caenimonas terrae TaxID=696074 RepID=A0ABW0N8F4_9BURK